MSKKKDAAIAKMKQQLTQKLTECLFSATIPNRVGELISLLGNLSGTDNLLSEVAEDILVQYYLPQDENNRLNMDIFKDHMTTLGACRYKCLFEPAYKIRMDTQDVHSDQYFAKELVKNPKINVIAKGLATAQNKVQSRDLKYTMLEQSDLISMCMKKGEDAAYKEPMRLFDPNKIYNNLSKEKRDAWDAEWNDYYIKKEQQETLAEILWNSNALSEDERRYWVNLFDEDAKQYWINDWVSHKADRDEYKRWQNGELTDEEWNLVKNTYSLTAENWEKNKEACRKNFFDDIYVPNWEEAHHNLPYHPEPEGAPDELNVSIDLSEDDGVESINGNWNDYFKNSVLGMNAFFESNLPPVTNTSDKYIREQAFLKHLETQAVEKQKEGKTEKEIEKMEQDASYEEAAAFSEQIYKLFTEGNFSFLDTKEYLFMKKAVAEAASNYVNTKNFSNGKKWVPEDPANDAVCKVMPLFDSISERLEDLSEDLEARDYNEIKAETNNLKKQLKKGSSCVDLKLIIETMCILDGHCVNYMHDHPRPFFFRWHEKRRYDTMKKLHKGIRKRLSGLVKALESETLRGNTADLSAKKKLETDRQSVETARQHLELEEHQEAKAEQYKQAQEKIQDGLQVIKDLREGRESLASNSSDASHKNVEHQNNGPQMGGKN